MEEPLSRCSAAEFTRVPYRTDTTILELFHERAAESPDAIAVEFGTERLTYGELDGKANDLAAQLAAAGVGHGDLTPMLVGSGSALPVSAIALMKLAAPFVPLDESWPASRLEAVLRLLDPKVVLCSPATVGAGPTGVGSTAGFDGPVLVVDTARLRSGATAPDVPGPTCEDLVYGFFTSGSTGVPKCALNAHQGLLNRFLTMTRRFEADGEVVLQNSRHVFDSSLWQLLWPLTTGARVVIPVRDGILDLAETVRVISRHGVTMTDFVPSIFNTLVTLIDADPELRAELGSLRRILIGGEEISPKAVRHFRRLMPGVRITNTYGPTECSIGSVFHEVGDEDPIPLGRAIDNTVAVVLDEEMRPVPADTVGEIHIGGDCMGRGYLGDPEKTAAVFVPNPFADIPGPLLYKTGDLGWTDPEGLLHFVGRRDNQVKLGGIRIELTEVEAALTQHPRVRDAKVVIAGPPDRQRLVAFVLAPADTDPRRLHEHVAALLPAVSVPKEIIALPEFPLTPNGKTDRRALVERARRAETAVPAPDTDSAPADELELRIHELWSALLGIAAIGTTTSFFELGGDSLTAQRLAASLRGVMGRSLSVRELVAHPTIRAQAALAGGAPAETGQAVLGRLRADGEPAADIRRAPGGAWSPGPVLLTGATGFIGAHLLHELLTRTGEQVVCLIRAEDSASALERIERSLNRYGLLDSTPLERIVPLVGDLSAPRLGLSPHRHAELAASVATVVHSGAMVNLLLGYDSHRPANVAGTAEILRLAAIGRRKHVHHVSTLGIFPAGALGGGPVGEDTGPLESAVPSDGYAQSKWVAERLVRCARERGLESSVYRLGEVGPHSGTGVPSERGLVDGLLCAAVDVGMRPRTSVSVDYTPVDHVTRLIVAAVVEGRVGGTYHPLRPGGFGLDELFRALGQWSPVTQVPYADFWRALGNSGDHALRLRAMLPDPEEAGGDALGRVFGDPTKRFTTDHADRLAEEAGIKHTDHAAVVQRCAAGCIERVHGMQGTRAGLPVAVGDGTVGVR